MTNTPNNIYNTLIAMELLPPPIAQYGINNKALWSANTPLLHTISRRVGRAFYCPLLIAFTLFLGSCESYEDPQNEVLKGYFEESKGLFLQKSDSISRFSYKVNEYISRTPAAKNDPFYTKIAENLQKLSLKITINDEFCSPALELNC